MEVPSVLCIKGRADPMCNSPVRPLRRGWSETHFGSEGPNRRRLIIAHARASSHTTSGRICSIEDIAVKTRRVEPHG